MKYRLKGGSHVQNNKIYHKGDIIDTSFDLCQLFRGKFEKVYEEVTDTGVEIPNLRARPNISPPPLADEGKEAATSEPSSDTGDVSDESQYGKDVTKDFPVAEELDVQVFEKSKWYTVIDTDDNKVLNEKKLRKKEVKTFLDELSEDDAEDDDDLDDED